jgi:hypothetical protein
MNIVVIEHVKLSDLPEPWRAKLGATPDARVTVRIEEESLEADAGAAFGMWGDREDMADVAGAVRRLRAPRFARD